MAVGWQVQDKRTQYRDSFYEIPVALRQLLDDTMAWIEYKTYPFDEIAVRFHHRLVYFIPSQTATAATLASWRTFW